VGGFGVECKNFQSLIGLMCRYVGVLQLQCLSSQETTSSRDGGCHGLVEDLRHG
jgi:hypothetical protein